VAALLAAICPSARIVLTSAGIARLPEAVLKDCAAAAFVAKEDLVGADLGQLFTKLAGT